MQVWKHQGPLAYALKNERGRELRKAMKKCLDARGCRVLVLMYGLHPEREHTALEVSRLLGLTPRGKPYTSARVWQIRYAAERKLAKCIKKMALNGVHWSSMA